MYRGSSSEHASSYKKAGHVNEKDFGALIGGSNRDLPNTGKTDWVDAEGRTYSIKRGFGCKKWQIFLYNRERINTDSGFQGLGIVGELLLKALDAFPPDYNQYSKDKSKVKEFLKRIVTEEDSGLSLFNKTKDEFQGKNSYVDSKVRLAIVTQEIASELRKSENLSSFVRKAMFNSSEVGHLAISAETCFEIYSQDSIVSLLAKALNVETSVAGTNLSDLNVAGQKVIMKQNRNVVELEIRNDSAKHYRELRFNMLAQPAWSLFREGTHALPHSTSAIEWREINSI